MEIIAFDSPFAITIRIIETKFARYMPQRAVFSFKAESHVVVRTGFIDMAERTILSFVAPRFHVVRTYFFIMPEIALLTVPTGVKT